MSKAEWVGEGGVDVLDPSRVVTLIFEATEEQSGSVWLDDLQLMTGLDVAVPVPTVSPPQAEPMIDKWALWADGTYLRGANIWQAIVIPELDGLEFKGPGLVGPPYTKEDFNRLATMGANYVSISGPGLFTEIPPYTVDLGVQDHLDGLLAMIAEADMFATIGFRTGPGRSEFSLCCGGDPYYEGYFNDSVWEDQAAQDAWVEMWRYTAERYRDSPIVAGYKLMVEPNAAGVLLDIYDPEEFYADYADTLYDWNQLYPRIVAGIRQVDPNTPILVGGMSWSGVAWLPYLQPTDDPRTVYVVHQYEPQDLYTHQEPDGENTYPGVFDTDWDSTDDQFDREWLDDLLSVVDEFAATHGVPVAVDEYGLIRWVPGGAAFMDDQMDLFEERGLNYALWSWDPSWIPWAEEVDAFNFLHGPDPDHHADVESSELMHVIVEYWGRNTTRPSNFAEEPTAPSAELPPEADFRRVIFLHHSCGANLIEQGGVRQRLTALGYEFYDHGYNEDGLVLADGTWTGRNFDVPDDNTDPDGFADIFAQPLHDPPDNTFSHLMGYDVIAFKSCFPVSNIWSDDELAEYKSYYLSIRDRMDQYPDRIFIVVTQPTEIPADTDAEAAARARAFTDWLASDEYLDGHPNVFTFNFFDLLADSSTNMLRAEYQLDEYDAHPNELANQTIGPLFVDFIHQAVRIYTAR